MPSALHRLTLADRTGQERLADGGFPRELITGTGADPRPRLRVDSSQTSFWENREFRSFYEFNIAAAQSVWLRFTTPVDLILHGRDITIVEGKLRFAQVTGGTPSGVWTASSVFPVNNMSDRPAYTSQMVAEGGGTLTGGTERDIMILETPSSGQASTIRAEIAELGLAPGAYYAEFRNTGNGPLRGLYKVHWEERQVSSPNIY